MTTEEFEQTGNLPAGWDAMSAEDKAEYVAYEEYAAECRTELAEPDPRVEWEAKAELLSDPTQPEYYSTYKEAYGEEAPDWEQYSARQRHLAREAECS